MGSQTVYLNAGTWYKEGDSVNHSTDTWLKCTYSNTGAYALRTILQFVLPTSLKYKKINSVTLNYYCKFIYNGSEITSGDSGMLMAPYVVSDTALSQVTGASLEAFGEVGDFITVESISMYTTTEYPRWRSGDVTSIFKSNLYDNSVFTAILKGLPGYTDIYYGAIGSDNSGYVPYLVINYEDVPQLPPTPNYPVSAYVNENTDLLFSWSWNSSTGAVQASAQLEYKLASAGSWTVVSLTQTGHTYTLIGGLPQGAYKWRIKGTNDAGETSDYSSIADFTVIGKPAAPTISTPANKALTTIEWTASDQNSFDIVLLDSNNVELINETVASSEASYKPNMLLKGSYTVKVRYRNSTGLSSDWSTKAFAINASGPSVPAMTLYGEGENARIVITPTQDTYYALQRAIDDGNNNFEIVGKFSGATFTDRTLKLNTPYVYKVSAWASAGYTDSAVQRYRAESEKICIQADGVELYLTRSDEEFMPYDEDSGMDIALVKCPGRKYPVVEHGENASWIFRTRQYVNEADKEKLKALAWKDYIFYRDFSGRAFPVAIQTLSFTRYMKSGYIADIEFVRTAEREVELNV